MPYKCGFLTLFQTISTSNGNPPCGSIGPPCLMHIKFGKTIDHGGYESPAEIKYGMVLAWPYSSNFIHVYVFYNGSRSFLKPPISGFSRRYTNIGCSIAHPRSSPNKHQQTLPISGDTHTISGSSQGTGWYVAILPDRRAWERLWRTTPGNTRCGHSKWIDPVTVVSKGIVNLTYWTMGLVFPKVLLTLLVMLWFILCERCK